MKTFISALLLLAAFAVHAQTAPDPLSGTARLTLPVGYPTILQVSCGGVKVIPYILSIDAQGLIHGELYATTSCSSGGRGARPHVYSAYRSIIWDFFGNYRLLPYDGGPLNPTETAVDAYGNAAYAYQNNGWEPTAWVNVVEVPPCAVDLST